ncbi:MAG: hypothetical protein U0992_01960 [Planctomycetaceae bacterium]
MNPAATPRLGTTALVLVFALIGGLSGCRSDARIVQNSRSRSTPAVSSKENVQQSPARTPEVAVSDSSAIAQLAKSAPPEKPRRFFPDLFRKNRDSQTIPLPTTPVVDEQTANASPVEEFQ